MLRMATSPASGRGEKKVSVRLGETLLRDRDAHLTLLGLHEIGKREHGAVSGPAQQSEDHEKADQARHRGKLENVFRRSVARFAAERMRQTNKGSAAMMGRQAKAP